MDMLQYYKNYFKNGGDYTMEAVAGPTSRVYQLIKWLEEETKPGDKILDVGCGDMYLSTRLPDREWYGVDVNLDKAKAKSGRVVEADLMRPPWGLESEFSAVVCSEVLEHVWDLRIVHREVYRLLKQGGVYMISTPNFNWIDNLVTRYNLITFDPSRPWTMEHIRHYTPASHEAHLKEAGFKLLDWTGLDAHYGEFFQEARSYLKFVLTKECGQVQYQDDAKLDYVLGRMFPSVSHTTALLAKKGA